MRRGTGLHAMAHRLILKKVSGLPGALRWPGSFRLNSPLVMPPVIVQRPTGRLSFLRICALRRSTDRGARPLALTWSGSWSTADAPMAALPKQPTA